MIIVGGIMTVPIPSLPLHWHQPLWLVSLQGYWGQRSHRANGEGLQYGGSYPSQMTYHVGGYVPETGPCPDPWFRALGRESPLS